MRRLLPIVLILTLTACSGSKDEPAVPGTRTVAKLATEVAPGTSLDPAQVSRTTDTLEKRLAAAGLADASAEASADGKEVTVTIPGEHTAAEIEKVISPGTVSFRKVLHSESATLGNAVPADGGGRAATLPTRDEVLAKLGPEGAVVNLNGEPTTRVKVAASKLTPAEVAVLPAETQYVLDTITCATLNARPARALPARDAPMAACDAKGEARYLLDVSKVDGADVAGAKASIGQQTGQWVIDIEFTTAGQSRWTALTKEAAERTGPACVDPGEGCLVAISVDHEVITAPSILSVITGPATISGAFTPDEAKLISAKLAFNSLPLAFSVSSVEVVG